MSLVGRLFGSRTDPGAYRDDMERFFYGEMGSRTPAGVRVNFDNAVKVPIVFGCLTVLKQTIASLPKGVFERRGTEKRPAPDHPLLRLLADPDGECTEHEFIEQMVWDLAGKGNALYELGTDSRGTITRLAGLDVKEMEVQRLADSSRRWRAARPGGQRQTFVEGEVWHLRNTPLVDGLIGTATISQAADAIGALMVLQEFGAAFFDRDATPPVVVSVDYEIKDEASRDNFRKALKKWFGNKRRGPAFLDGGAKATKLGTTNEEAQFLETRKALALDIARYWRMPPHIVQMLEDATFSNIEHQSLEFVQHTIMPWIDLIESSINRFLLGPDSPFFFEFNVAGLLRADVKARFEAYALGRQWGWLSVNEIRAAERQNGIGPRGDQYLAPLNMEPVGVASGRVPQRGASAGAGALLDARGDVVSRFVNGQWEGRDAA